MIFVEGKTDPIPAGTLEIGDIVKTIRGSYPIYDIKKITRPGLYNPLTKNGMIIANEFISSTYSAFSSNNEWIEVAGYKIPITHQKFFNLLLKPYEIFCSQISLEMCKSQ